MPTTTAASPPYPTHNDLAADVRARIVALGAELLADGVDLQTQAKQAHWNVKGPAFLTLHELFDRIADAVAEYVDQIAERIVQLGGVAAGTARTAARASRLPEPAAAAANANAHLAALLASLASFGAASRRAIEVAATAGDQNAADLFTGISRGVDKWIWFVEAHLHGRA
jgi:starvation-inducible DNA-binding protein